MSEPIPSRYEPSEHEAGITERWLERRAFAATPDERDPRYVVMMPLPNVTGALHMGHAMDNVMQDLLIRWHRMLGDNTLWMPGTDHAGIATQAVVEKRLFEHEQKTRHDVGREGLIERIWEWKERSEKRIISQQQQMGCSCDWERHRFTMDAVCARAVREIFHRLFADGLIYRGLRLVNWDCHLQTAVSDDEVEHRTIAGHFWHLRYPVLAPKDGEPTHVEVATTRPETMLGDTGVAVHPSPRAFLEQILGEARERQRDAGPKERLEIEAEIESLEARIAEHLPRMEQLVAMAKDGRKLRLPLMDREIPLILDEWAKPQMGSGCVKITPAHDPNDYEVWQRHPDELRAINILNPDGTLNENAGAYRGLDRFEARKKVVADLDAAGLLARVEDREIQLGHSDRSKTPVEPYLSRQWFVRMSDVEGGVVMARGTDKEFVVSGLAQAAIDAVEGEWRTATGRKLGFHPDPERYAGTYVNWLAEKRDWCISRQLWWGHRIPIWSRSLEAGELAELIAALPAGEGESWTATLEDEHGRRHALEDHASLQGRVEIALCIRSQDEEEQLVPAIESLGLERDPDVLDTWFSSSLWPFSTLGWPDPETAPGDERTPLGAQGPTQPDALSYYYPGSCLVTGRDIITLWVARMAIMGLYTLGDLPFTDCFIHATILDGKGERMSKSKGNGIDPVDIIEAYGTDALRWVLCMMQTGMQDIRLPVQALSPTDGELIELATAKPGPTLGTYLDPRNGEVFDVLGTHPTAPQAKTTSDRFEVGRNFCTKLWNASRFVLMNLGEGSFTPLEPASLPVEDRWLLSRLSRGVAEVSQALAEYRPSSAVEAARDLFWNDLCDWYLELVKPRTKANDPVARQVLTAALDQVLRLLHPFIPFVTEALWSALRAQAGEVRGIGEPFEDAEMLITARWPLAPGEWRDASLETEFELFREVVEAVREVRATAQVPSKPLPVSVRGPADAIAALRPFAELLGHMTQAEGVTLQTDAPDLNNQAVRAVRELEVLVGEVIDPERERERLSKEIEKLEKQLKGITGKLSNQGFLAGAPEAVVAQTKKKQEECTARLAILRESLERLG